jgi:hypothetical protein
MRRSIVREILSPDPTRPVADAVVPLPANVAYWKRGEAVVNFGDYLTELLHARLFDGPPIYPEARIHLIGSVIAPSWIEAAAREGYRQVVFWGCGLRRETSLAPEIRRRIVLLGVRGPLSRDRLGLPVETTPLGDPALLLPRIVSPVRDRDTAGRAVCMPHFLDTTGDAALLSETGAGRVLRPNMAPDLEACERIISAIASARFVLAGALHGAIVAYAYGVPFAFYNARRIDVPFKWRDFASSIGYDCTFADTVADGLRFHAANRGRSSGCSPDGLLAVAPFPLKPVYR